MVQSCTGFALEALWADRSYATAATVILQGRNSLILEFRHRSTPAIRCASRFGAMARMSRFGHWWLGGNVVQNNG